MVCASFSAASEAEQHVRAELGNTSAWAGEQRGHPAGLESTGAWGSIVGEGSVAREVEEQPAGSAEKIILIS